MHRISKIIIAGFALLAVAVAAAGCGGSGGSGAKRVSLAQAKTPQPVANDADWTPSDPNRIPAMGAPSWEPAPAQRGDTYIGDVQSCDVCKLQPVAMYNNTPYTWTLDKPESWNEYWRGGSIGGPDPQWVAQAWNIAAPPETVPPGGAVHLWKVSSGSNQWTELWVGYTFQDKFGGKHMVLLRSQSDNHVIGISNDWAGPDNVDWQQSSKYWVLSANTFYIKNQPGGTGDQPLGAFLSGGTLQIDATKDPELAANALNLYATALPGTKTFQKTAGPFYTHPAAVPGSPTLIDASNGGAWMVVKSSTTNTQSTTLSEELTVKAEFDLFDLVGASVSASADSSQKWASSLEVANGQKLTLDKCEKGTFSKETQVQNFTGNVNFFSQGVQYFITQATFSMPGIADTSGNGPPVQGTVFNGHTQPLGQAEIDATNGNTECGDSTSATTSATK